MEHVETDANQFNFSRQSTHIFNHSARQKYSELIHITKLNKYFCQEMDISEIKSAMNKAIDKIRESAELVDIHEALNRQDQEKLLLEVQDLNEKLEQSEVTIALLKDQKKKLKNDVIELQLENEKAQRAAARNKSKLAAVQFEVRNLRAVVKRLVDEVNINPEVETANLDDGWANCPSQQPEEESQEHHQVLEQQAPKQEYSDGWV